MVVLEHLIPTALLSIVMLSHGPPSHDLLVAPGGVREDPSGTTDALEALVVDEAIDSFQDRLQSLRQVQIEVEPLRPGMDFEDH
jgi:hypothetical protein